MSLKRQKLLVQYVIIILFIILFQKHSLSAKYITFLIVLIKEKQKISLEEESCIHKQLNYLIEIMELYPNPKDVRTPIPVNSDK